ncbi:MAG: peptide ABC transporter substrate-binding protein, partial [Pseudomonadota bacterium]|nr:peptide ABC transporter substrate-binding protein [Pseudomonadota bacterium]
MKRNYGLLDSLRLGKTAHQNHLIDGLLDGRVSRRDFLRHGSLLGLSLPVLGSVTAAAGFASAPTRAVAQGAPGATIRVAAYVPKKAVDPVLTGDGGGLLMLQQTGEFLCFDGPDLVLQPMLAESW